MAKITVKLGQDHLIDGVVRKAGETVEVDEELGKEAMEYAPPKNQATKPADKPNPQTDGK